MTVVQKVQNRVKFVFFNYGSNAIMGKFDFSFVVEKINKEAQRQRAIKNSFEERMCGAGKAERAERSGLPRFFFGYFLCSNDKESNNKK